MTFATAMWIAMALIAAALVITVALEERRHRREVREARRQWENEIDRRIR